MKLIRFTTADWPNPCFGIVVRDQAVPFAVLQAKAGKASPHLADSRSYLANLPESQRAAKELLTWGEQHLYRYRGRGAFARQPSAFNRCQNVGFFRKVQKVAIS